MSDQFEVGCLCGAVRFVATGQPGYLGLGDQDGLSLPVRIDAPIGTEKPIPEIVDYRKIAIGMPVVEKMELLPPLAYSGATIRSALRGAKVKFKGGGACTHSASAPAN